MGARRLFAAVALVALCGFGAAIATASSGASQQTCQTYGAVGVSSATVQLPKSRGPVRDVVTATADQVADATFPQTIHLSGTLAPSMSSTMNPAYYNTGNVPNLGGAIEMWDSVNHISSAATSVLTATALNPGGTVRVSVWSCAT